MASKLIIQIIADIKEHLKGLSEAQKATDKFAKSAEQAGGAIGGSLNQTLKNLTTLSGGGAAAVGVLAGAFVAAGTAAVVMAKEAAKQAETLHQLDQQTGIHTSTMQAYDVQMRRVGLTTEEFTRTFSFLSRRITDARHGNREAIQSFEQLGISIADLSGDPEQALRQIADRVAAMPPGFERTNAVVDLLGKGAARLIPFLAGGAAEMDRVTAKADEMGARLSAGSIKRLAELDDKFDDLGTAMRAFQSNVGSLVEPAISRTIELFTKATSAASRFVQSLAEGSPAIKAQREELAKLQEELNAIAAALGRGEVPASADPTKNIQAIFQAQQLSEGEAAKIATQNAFAAQAAIERTQVALAVAKQLGTSFEVAWDMARGATLNQVEAIVAAGKAEQTFAAQGQAIRAREAAERNAAFAIRLEQAQRIRELGGAPSFTPVQGGTLAEQMGTNLIEHDLSQIIENYNEIFGLISTITAGTNEWWKQQDELVRGAMHLIDLGVEIEGQPITMGQAMKLAAENAAHASSEIKHVQGSLQSLQATEAERITSLEASIALGEQLWRAGVLGAEQMRASAIELVDEQERQAIRRAEAEGASLTKIIAIEERAMAQRMGIARQYPTFWEQQLQAMVQSNTFSLASIVSTWTSSLAQAIVEWDSFNSVIKSAWKSTQIAIIQGILNTTAQKLVQWGLETAFQGSEAGKQLAAWLGLEKAKTVATTTAEGARVVVSVAAGKAIAASYLGQLAAMTALSLGMVTMAGFVAGTVVAMMGAVASALAASIVLAKFSAPVAAAAVALAIGAGKAVGLGTAAITGASATAAGTITTALVTPLQEGGFIVGEAGPEAVIPLNHRGQEFFESWLGRRNEMTIEVPVHLDGREIARAIARHLPRGFSGMGAPAIP